ncbi:hypothetical protein VKT23_015522 [Stygiomarasmius scandens]|uniref:Vacuolar protein sorting-associated protein 13 second N-terminal domain-containing protein n=1 Tax=Marasmiellus scandens TaxID=2682957 RepID=A0ABR1J0L3_9AGAR
MSTTRSSGLSKLDTSQSLGSTPPTSNAATSSRPRRNKSRLEELEDRIVDAAEHPQAKFAAQFLSDNKEDISNAAKAFASSENVKDIQDKVKNFTESSKFLMDVLSEVEKLHPFIGVAVMAFKAAVSLELKRRDNDQRVAVLRVKMQDLMEVFVQLGAISPEQRAGKQKFTVRDRLESLCGKIADDIKSCGNLCDAYLKKRVIVRILKSPLYEARFEECAQTFEERQKELLVALLMFTSKGIHSANASLTEAKETLRSTQKKVDLILLFQVLQTPREKKILAFIETNGGAEACMRDDETLRELLKLRKEISSNEQGRLPTSKIVPVYTGTRPYYETTQPGYAIPVEPVNRTHRYRRPSFSSTRSPSPVPIHIPPPAPVIPMTHDRDRRDTYDHGQYYSHGYRTTTQHYEPQSQTRPYSPAASVNSVKGFSHGQPWPSRTSQPQISDRLVAVVREELSEDVDEGLSKNLRVYLRKFHEQERQLKNVERTVVKQGDRIVAVIREGAHDRVHDPELRAIWKEMGWKLGVPAVEFVSTLHDYYVAEHTITERVGHELITEFAGENQILALRKAFDEAKKRAAESWALKYINLVNLRPLVEVFDSDVSGYVSVWEANEVISLRPEGWSLVQWIAFWAAGRHFAIWSYRQKIAAMLSKAYAMLDEVLPTNRSFIDRYIQDVYVLDQILKSTIPSKKDDLDSRLIDKVEAYMKTEEQRMEKKLEALRYEIDAQDTLALIVGNNQIERNFYPLVYLLVRRHLSFMKTGCRVALDRQELKVAMQSLRQIFQAISSRISTMKVIFSQRYMDAEIEMKNVAYGMYHQVYIGGDPYSGFVGEEYPSESEAEDVSEGVLHYPSPSVHFFQRSFTDPIEIQSCIGSGIEGYWSGHLFDENKVAIHGMFQFKIESHRSKDRTSGQPKRNFVGAGSYSGGRLQVRGVLDLNSRKLHMVVDGQPDYAGDPKLQFDIRARLSSVKFNDPELSRQYTVSGKWGKANHPRPLGTLFLSQTPAWVHEFRQLYGLTNQSRRTGKSLWRFACNAIMYQVTSKRGTLRSHIASRKFIEYRRGAEISRLIYLDCTRDLDWDRYNKLRFTSTPWDARFYKSIARANFGLTLHFDVKCASCRTIILGPRFICVFCLNRSSPWDDPTMSFCSQCFLNSDLESKLATPTGIPHTGPYSPGHKHHAFVKWNDFLHYPNQIFKKTSDQVFEVTKLAFDSAITWRRAKGLVPRVQSSNLAGGIGLTPSAAPGTEPSDFSITKSRPRPEGYFPGVYYDPQRRRSNPLAVKLNSLLETFKRKIRRNSESGAVRFDPHGPFERDERWDYGLDFFGPYGFYSMGQPQKDDVVEKLDKTCLHCHAHIFENLESESEDERYFWVCVTCYLDGSASENNTSIFICNACFRKGKETSYYFSGKYEMVGQHVCARHYTVRIPYDTVLKKEEMDGSSIPPPPIFIPGERTDLTGYRDREGGYYTEGRPRQTYLDWESEYSDVPSMF